MYALLLLYRRSDMALLGPEIFLSEIFAAMKFCGCRQFEKKGLYNVVGVCYYLFRQGM
jgi:hypothetical protein